jgi:hypothetical protein
MLKILMYLSLLICNIVLARIEVAVIDTGIDVSKLNPQYLCAPPRDFTEGNYHDYNGHGTNVIGLIIKGLTPKQVCIHSLKFYHTSMNAVHYYSAIKYLNTMTVDVVNLSLNGNMYYKKEYQVIDSLLKRGTEVFSSAGNDGKEFTREVCEAFPACYVFNLPKLRVVSDPNAVFSNKGPFVNTYALGVDQCALGICKSGTSQATANATNRRVKELLVEKAKKISQ